MKNVISIQDFSVEEIIDVLDRAEKDGGHRQG